MEYYRRIVADFPTPNNEPKKKFGYSVGRHNEYLKYLVDNYPGIVIIILDEIDKVEIPKIVNRIIRFENSALIFPKFNSSDILYFATNKYINFLFAPFRYQVNCRNYLLPQYQVIGPMCTQDTRIP